MAETRSSRELSIRLSEDVRDDVSHLAKAIGQTPNWVIERAVTVYLAGEGADLLAVAIGDAEFAAGESEDFDVVLADLNAILRGKAA